MIDHPLYINDLEYVCASVDGWNALAGSNVLVTGATGLLGTALIDVLMYYNRKRNGHIHVYAMGRSEESANFRFGAFLGDPDFHFILHDLSFKYEGSEFFDYIVHAAGNAHPVAFATDPVGTMTANFLGTYFLLEYGRMHGLKRMLYVSSGEVYGQPSENMDGFYESYSGYVDPVSVRSCYPSSKRASETLCVSYAKQYGIDVVITRPCHAYGPTQTRKDSRAVAQFIRNALDGHDIVLKSKGEQVRSYCYAADTVSGFLTALLSGQTCNAYNIANKNSIASIRELAGLIAEYAGTKVRFEIPDEIEKSGFTVVTRGVLLGNKLEGIGWAPQYSLPRGIERTISILKG